MNRRFLPICFTSEEKFWFVTDTLTPETKIWQPFAWTAVWIYCHWCWRRQLDRCSCHHDQVFIQEHCFLPLFYHSDWFLRGIHTNCLWCTKCPCHAFSSDSEMFTLPSLQNFDKFRGTAMGVLKAQVGLCGAIFVTVRNRTSIVFSKYRMTYSWLSSSLFLSSPSSSTSQHGPVGACDLCLSDYYRLLVMAVWNYAFALYTLQFFQCSGSRGYIQRSHPDQNLWTAAGYCGNQQLYKAFLKPDVDAYILLVATAPAVTSVLLAVFIWPHPCDDEVDAKDKSINKRFHLTYVSF